MLKWVRFSNGLRAAWAMKDSEQMTTWKTHSTLFWFEIHKIIYLAIYCNCYAWTYCKYKVWFWRIFKCESSFNISMGYYNALWLPLWPFNLLLVWSDKTKNRAAKIFDFWCVRIRFLLWLVRILRLSKNCLWINKYSVLMSHTTRIENEPIRIRQKLTNQKISSLTISISKNSFSS